MATQYTSLLGLALPVTGELSGSWGDVVNTSITSLLDSAISGTTALTTDADVTLTTTTGVANQARQAIILWNPASGTVTRNITVPAQSKIYTVINASGGTQSIVLRGAGPTTGVTIIKGESAVVAWNGTDFVKISNTGGGGSFTNVTISGTTTLSGLTASTALALDASKNVVSVTNTGTGNNVLSASPTLTGTISGANASLSGTLGVTGVATLTAQPILSSLTASQAVFTDASKGLVSNAITGTGNVVMSASPTLTGTITAAAANFSGAVALGDAAADNITVNGTVTSNLLFTDNTYDIGASGATRPRNLFLAGNATVGGNIVLTGSLDLTNLEVTNIKAKDGTAGMQIADSTGVVSFTANPVMSGGTANGVAYLNGSNVLTTGSALTFDGTSLFVQSGGTNAKFDAYTAGQKYLDFTWYGSSIGSISQVNGTYIAVDSLNALPFLIGGSEQMRLTSTGLGIGTSSPAYKVDVQTPTSASARIFSTTATSGTATLYLNVANNFSGVSQAYIQGIGPGSSGVSQLAFGTAGSAGDVTATERMRLDSSGNLGIGLSSPSYKLDVNGSTRVIGTFILQNGDFALTTKVDPMIYTAAANPLRFGINSAEEMRLTSTGLGIGTSSPQARLEAASISTGAVVEVLRLSNNGSGANTQARINFAVNTTSYATLTGGYGASAPQMTFDLPNGTPGNYVWQISSSEKMILDSSGNLGIGTSSPGSKLDVFQTGAATVVAFGKTNVAQFLVGFNGTSNNYLDGDNNIFRSGNGSEQMRLTSTGLGIGTSSPVARLEAAKTAGTAQFAVSTNGNAGSTASPLNIDVDFLGYNNGNRARIRALDQTGNTFASPLTFWTHDGSAFAERMRLDPPGNLGLGVTPSAWSSGGSLELAGGKVISFASAFSNIAANAYYNGGFKYITTATAALYAQNTGQHQWFTAPSGTAGNAISFTQAMTLDASGRWLLGTTTGVGNDFASIRFNSSGTYSQGLNMVDANASASGATFQVFRKSDDTYLGNIRRNGTDNAVYVGGNSYLALGSGDTERARITSGGDLCVGTTSAVNSARETVSFQSSSGGTGISFIDAQANNTACFAAFYSNATQIGSITNNGNAAVLYNVTSDQRLKKNIIDAPEFGGLIDSIKVRSYDWIANETHQRAGFIAQELVTVAPEAVHQPADPEQMMAVDYSKLVPMLVKEIQSLRQRLAAAGI